MTKISLSQISGVAVTAFALCIVLGALLTVTMHQPASIIVGGLLGVYLLFAIKIVPAMGKGCSLAFGEICGAARTGIVPHRACR